VSTIEGLVSEVHDRLKVMDISCPLILLWDIPQNLASVKIIHHDGHVF
jgi:hypothetical protein